MFRVSTRPRATHPGANSSTHSTSSTLSRGFRPRFGVALLLVLTLTSLVPSTAVAAVFAARAHVIPNEQYLDDTAKPLAIAVRNAGTVFIGAVEIRRPGTAFSIVNCLNG